MTTPETATFRLKLDQVNDTLTSPGEQLGKSVGKSNEWAMRVLAFLFGIAVFGIGLRILAEWIEKSGTRRQGPAAPNTSGGFTAGSR
jgi:hypothetical protein